MAECFPISLLSIAVPQYHSQEAAVLRTALEDAAFHQVVTMEMTQPEHPNDSTSLQLHVISSKAIIHSAQTGNPNEQVKTPSLPTKSWEMLGKATVQEQQVGWAAGKRLGQTRGKGKKPGTGEEARQPSGDCSRVQKVLQKVRRGMAKVHGAQEKRKSFKCGEVWTEDYVQAHFIFYKCTV